MDVDLYVDGRTYPITMYTVSDSNDVIIGRSLFQTSAELRVGPKAVEIIDAREVRQLMAIDMETLELEVGERAYLLVVQKMVNSYTSCVEMRHVELVPLKVVTEEEHIN